MAKPVLYGTFARACGVSVASVSVAARKSLKAARVPSPTRRDRFLIDVEHPAAIAYHRRHYATATPLDELTGIDALPPPPPNVDLLSQYGDWSLIQLLRTFGKDERFKTWLAATKLIVEIHMKNLTVLDREAVTIDRDLVRQHVFGYVNDSNQRLLIDAPATIARRVSAHATSGGDMETAERIVREEISRRLRASQLAAIAGLEAQIDQAGTIERPASQCG